MSVSSSVTLRFSRARVLLAALVSCLPLNWLRVLGLRHLLGYRIGPGARIGLFTLIACESFTAGARLLIGRQNRFVGPMRVTIGDDVLIGRFNDFSCGASAALRSKAAMNYARRLSLGDRVLVNDRHYFDLYGEIRVGAGTWIAGMGSQFWTHGASAMDRDIAIGEKCYLGSAIRMAPGTAIGDGCVLAIGAVVVSKLAETDAVLAGIPARKLRDISPEDARQFVFEKD